MDKPESESLIIKNPCKLNLADRLSQVITKVGQVGRACELDSHSSTRSVFSHQQPFSQSSYAVVLEAEQVIGVLTAQEIVGWLSTQVFSEDCQLNRGFISSVLPLAESDLTTQIAAIHLLLQRKASCIPIVDAQNQCVGLLTTESVARFSQPLAPLRLQTVGDVMQAAPTIVSGDCSMGAIAQQMAQQETRVLVLTVEGNDLNPQLPSSWGIIRAQDIVQLLALGVDLNRVPAITILQPIATIASAETLWSAYQQIDQQGGYPLAVTSAQGHLVGLLSLDDVLRAFDPLVLYQLSESCAVKLAASEPSEPIDLPLQSEACTNPSKPISGAISYDSFMAASPVGILRTDTEGICTYVNDRYCEILGLDQTTLLGQPWSVGYRPEDLERIVAEYEMARCENRPWSIEYQFQRPDGSGVWVYGQTVVEYNSEGQEIGFIGTITDISDRKRTEFLLESQHKVLERIAKAEPLPNILNALLQTTEFHLPGTYCSILLCEADHLHCIAAPSLPPGYCDAVDGAPIGEGIGSCGTAAFRREVVIVSDIATDPLWQDYQHLALAHNLRACWSAPIISSEDTVLGVFGIYYQEQRTPLSQDLERLRQSANIAGIAIERAQATQALLQLNQELEHRVKERTADLQTSEERWQLALKGANDGIWDWNPQSNQLFVSQRLKEMRGYYDDELPSALEDWLPLVHPDDRDRVCQAIADHLAGETEFFQLEYRVLHKNGSYIWILSRAQAQWDVTGQAIRIIGSESDITQRKQAELALQASEKLYATLAEASSVAICRFDAPMNCVYVSDRWSEMTGRPVESALGRGWIEAIHPDDLERLLAPWSNPATQPDLVPPAAIQGLEGRHLRPDGSINWFYVQARPEFDEEGQICGCISTLTDITELKRVEAELAESEAKFRRLVEGGNDVIWALDSQWRFTYLSPQFKSLSGWEAGEWIDHTCIEAVYPEDQALVLAHHANHANQSAETYLEFRMRHRDRPYIWVRISSAPVLDVAGELVGYQGILTDITDRKNAELALQESERRYASLAAAAPVAIFRFDRQPLNCVYVNERWSEMTGRPAESALGRGWIEALHPEDRERAISDWSRFYTQNLLPTGGPTLAPTEGRHLRPDGTVNWFYVQVAREFDDSGNVVGYVGTLTDITERKMAELALQESQAQFHRMTENVPGMIYRYVLHADGYQGFTYISPQVREIYEVEADEVIQNPELIWARIHPDDVLLHQSKVLESAVNLTPAVFEHRLTTPSGLKFVKAITACPERQNDGSICWDGVVIDLTDRKMAELALQESQAQFHRMTENVPGMIYRYVLHPDGTDEMTYVSAQVREVFEVEPATVLQDITQIWARIHPDDIPWLGDAIRVSAETLQPFTSTYRLLLPHKGLRWVQNMSHAERLENGDVVWDGIVVDISDRKTIEQELVLKQNHLEALLNNIPHIAWIKDEQSRFIAVNQPFADACGFAVENIIGLTDHDIWPDELAQAYRSDDFEVLQSGQRKVVEEPLSLADGTFGWLETTKTPFRDGNGNFAGTVGIAANISDRKQAELALEQEVLRRSTIFNASSDGIHILDSNANLLEANISFFQMLGYTPEEASKFNVSDWDAQLTREEVQSNLQNFPWETSRIRKVETLHRRKDGSIFPVEIYICRMEWDGQLSFICIARDISERKQAEAQLQRTNEELLRATRLKDEFLANMSHELRTPLNAILGMSEALQDQMFGLLNEQQLKMVRTLEQSGEHLLALINDILDVAKIESGQLDLEYTPVDVSQLCQSSLTFIKQQAFKKGIQLNIQLPTSPLPKLYLDDRRIRQVLINLLNNAVKFTLEGGCITLKVISPWDSQAVNDGLSSACPMLQVSVIDTGIGIAQENISKLFQPFVQIDGALNRQYAGTGLGLALVKRIVELHDGEVCLKSELGVGSCFTVTLPYLPSETVDETKSTHRVDETKPSHRMDETSLSLNDTDSLEITILLAEDNEDNIKVVVDYLEVMGYHVVVAHNGQEAIERVQSLQPDLILMDIQMPGMDGLAAIQKIREIPDFSNIPIIALTALAMPGDEVRCLDSGATDYLSKPVRLKNLHAKIQSYVGLTP